MKLYMIRDTTTGLWYRHPSIGGRRWVAQIHASIFRSNLDAEAHVEHDDCKIIEFTMVEKVST